MQSKVRMASGITVAATVLTVLFSAQGSGAFAEEIDPTALPQATSPQFISQPVVQPAPQAEAAQPESAPASDADDQAAQPGATLASVVESQEGTRTRDREMQCLAGAVYFEARGESLKGQLAVARVIVGRAQSGRFPDSYCGVVYQPSQFSFVHGRRMPAIKTSSRAWRRAVAVARIADKDSWESPAEGALFFHAARVRPGWKLKRVAQIDNHVFYR